MPKLNEYLGSIVSSITEARMMSDIQTVKVAEEFAKHPLLQHFTIPRMRIDEIELSIPVALDDYQVKRENSYEPIDNNKFNALIYNELTNSIGLSKLPEKLSVSLRSEISRRTKSLEEEIRISGDLTPLKNFCREMVGHITTLDRENPNLRETRSKRINLKSLPDQLEKRVTPEIKVASVRESIENLNVIVEANRLRDEKPDNIIFIKMKISENGLEWSHSENSKGERERRLLPE